VNAGIFLHDPREVRSDRHGFAPCQARSCRGAMRRNPIQRPLA